jgi:hypothetical protein
MFYCGSIISQLKESDYRVAVMSHHVPRRFHHQVLHHGNHDMLPGAVWLSSENLESLKIGFSRLFPKIEHGDAEVRDLVRGWILDGPGGAGLPIHFPKTSIWNVAKNSIFLVLHSLFNH